MKKKGFVAPAVLPLILACMSFGVGAETDALVREASEATSRGQGKTAYDLLSKHEVERAGDPDFDLAFGMAANANNQFSRAIMALERVLVVQPDHPQARAELGRALYAVGDNRAARKLLGESQSAGLVAAAGENIDQLLQAIDRVDAAGRSSYKGYVEGGAGHDSNANSATADRSFAVPAFGGTLLVLNPSSVRTRAAYGTLGGAFSGRAVLNPRWSVIGSFNALTRNYSGGNSQFDVRQADLVAGLSYRVERTEYTLVAQTGLYDIGGTRVRNQAGVVGEWTYRFDGFRQFSSYFQVNRLSYPQLHVADVDRKVAGVAYAHIFRNGVVSYGGVYVGREEERGTLAYFGHKLIGARGGVQYPVSTNTAAFGTLSYETRKFGGTDPLFLTERNDQQATATVGVSWVPAQDWRLTPQLAWLRTRSNVATAAYDKTVASLTLRREF